MTNNEKKIDSVILQKSSAKNKKYKAIINFTD